MNDNRLDDGSALTRRQLIIDSAASRGGGPACLLNTLINADRIRNRESRIERDVCMVNILTNKTGYSEQIRMALL